MHHAMVINVGMILVATCIKCCGLVSSTSMPVRTSTPRFALPAKVGFVLWLYTRRAPSACGLHDEVRNSSINKVGGRLKNPEPGAKP